MKKAVSLFLALTMLLLAGSCAASNIDEEKFTVTATIFPQYDFLREITKGADIKLEMLISPGMEVHGFEATLSDVASVSESDLFVYVGGEDDAWVEKIDVDSSKKLALTQIIENADEHMWTSPKNAVKIVQALCERLVLLNPENAEIYEKNTRSYLSELSELDNAFEEICDKPEKKTLVFADRFPFEALAKDYNLEYYSAFEGCSDESEAGIKTINFLINKINEENISAIFVIEFSNLLTAEKISEETGAKICAVHSCHNLTEEEFEGGETYLSLMEKNLEEIKTALG